MTDHLAAIRAAAERILRNIDFTHYSLHAEQDDAAREILRLLDEAEKDDVTAFREYGAESSFDVSFAQCQKCGYQVMTQGNYCPGCGRRIEGGTEG